MPKSDLIHLFHTRWQEIARRFWPATPREQLESELARLDAELARRQKRLFLSLKRIDKLHQSLKRHTDRLALLAVRKHEKPVNAGAVETLERRRQTVAQLRERLREREHEYAWRLSRLRQRKQERAELRARLLSGSLPKRVDEESDADYPF